MKGRKKGIGVAFPAAAIFSSREYQLFLSSLVIIGRQGRNINKLFSFFFFLPLFGLEWRETCPKMEYKTG